MNRRAGYRPEWDINLPEGQESERYVAGLLNGAHTVEVKRDFQAHFTGYVYIEYECIRGGTWQPSGLGVTTADLWALHLPPSGLVLFIPTDDLKRICRARWADERNRRELTEGTHPTRGVTVPVAGLVTSVYRAAR